MNGRGNRGKRPIRRTFAAWFRAFVPIALGAWPFLGMARMGLADEPAFHKLLGGLRSPCSIAIRPEIDGATQVFVADRGSGRVLRIDGGRSSDAPTQEAIEAVVGFPTAAAAIEQPDAVGVQSILFLDQLRLVASGRESSGQPFLNIYELSGQTGALPFTSPKQIAKLPSKSLPGEAIFHLHDLSRSRANDLVPDFLLAAASGEAGVKPLWRIGLAANTLGDVTPYAATLAADAASSHVVSIGSIATAPTGHWVIASRNTAAPPAGDLVTFLMPHNGQVAMQITTSLPRIVALAYHPRTGELFAASAATGDGTRGGIYRLDDASTPGNLGCRATPVASLARPTAIAFDPLGTLYVAALEAVGEKQAAGVVLRLELSTK
ncbi:MAG: hypothetical protein IT425_09120 [Pirellulales bacterium]|nr:hypothetical protein [Pirellulales bacterium]